MRTEEERSARSSSMTASASRSAWTCWSSRTSSVGVAVAGAPDPAAEAQGAGIDGQVDAEAGELVDERLQGFGHGVAVQLVEVVDGVAGLVDDVGLGHAQ